MGTEAVVFLGPSLSPNEAMDLLDAVYLPPAEMGDIFRAVLNYRPTTIAIIDGVFAQRPAIRHKEIIFAMACGVNVCGASSMGAIRAAELSHFGMKGHGFIYRWYRQTPLADDDDVAIAIAPPELGSAALSDALIDIRMTLRRAQRKGLICQATRVLLEVAARSICFTDRLYAAVLSAARCASTAECLSELDAFERWLPGNAVSQKRADAMSLLRHIALSPAPASSPSTTFFEMTEAWALDLEAALLWETYVNRGQWLLPDDIRPRVCKSRT